MVEEVKKELYKKVMRTFTLKDLTRQRDIQHGKNLVELISRYPGNGLGFKVRDTQWPEDEFVHVTRVNLFVSSSNLLIRAADMAESTVSIIKDQTLKKTKKYR